MRNAPYQGGLNRFEKVTPCPVLTGSCQNRPVLARQNHFMENTMKIKEFSLSDKLTFGKYKGYTIEEILEDDPSYLEWAIDEIEWFELDYIAAQKLNDNLGYNDYMQDVI
jgi:hypothetical protein